MYLQCLYGLWEALLIAELIYDGMTTGKYEGLTWETHSIDLAFGSGTLSVSVPQSKNWHP